MLSRSAGFAEEKYLTGLRGVASLGVFLVHFSIVFPFPDWSHPFVTQGQHGVIVFFVLSAFTLSLSVGNRFSVRAFFIRRFFRIAPAYYAVLIYALLRGYQSYWADQLGASYNFSSFVWHALFINWLDYKQQNNALGVEWTLSIEMLFYFLLPLMLFATRWRAGNVFLLAAALVCLWMAQTSDVPEEWKWLPTTYAICFAAGVVAFRLRTTVERLLLPNWFSATAVLSILVVLLVPNSLPYQVVVLMWSAGTAGIILLGRSMICRILFENAVALQIGKYSYSLYLVHLPIIMLLSNRYGSGLLSSLLAIAITPLATLLLFHLVEQPGRGVGRWLAAKVRAPGRILVSSVDAENAPATT